MEETPILSREELADFYRRHVGMVYQICLMLLKHVPDAEDATQTVFQKVMERNKPFQDREHEKAWLIVTARNQCRNQLRHWWRTRRAGEEALQTMTWEQPEDEEVWESILTLPEKERTVLYLYYYQGYSTLEIADILGKNPSTVRTWLVRARWKLKDVLEVNEYGRL